MPQTAGQPALPRASLMLLLGLSPAVVLATVALAAVVLISFRLPVYPRELLAAALVATVSGLVSVLPIVRAARTGRTDTLAMAALKAMALRMALMLGGTLLALGPGWELAQLPLVLWILAFYFPLLAAETATVARMLNRQDYR